MLAAKTFLETPAGQLTPQMERDFFSSLMTRDKTYKTTFHKRFPDANKLILEHLQVQGLKAPTVLDIGISSGISTVELFDDLRAGGCDASIVGTDVLFEAFLVRTLPGCYVLIDETGFPLRFDLPIATMKPWVIRRDYYTGFFVLRKSINLVLGRMARRILLRSKDRHAFGVRLVTPRLANNKKISIRVDDARKFNHEFCGNFDVIRAANILNNGYFTPSEISSMVLNMGRYLRRPSGVLLVVRTLEDGTNEGCMFRLGEDGRFVVACRIGKGSEVEGIVAGVVIPNE